MQATFHRTITNELHDLEKLMNASTNFLEDRDVDAHAVYRINLALEEMITNIIRHGYDDYDGHEIQVTIEVRETEIAAIIEDDGHEFNPLEREEKAQSASLEESEVGGRGIRVVKKLLDHIDYRRENEKNILQIRVHRQSPAGAA